MEIKKSPKANLEKYKLMFLTFGLIISLGLLISAFSWSSSSAKSDMVLKEDVEEEEMMEITRQDFKEPPPPPKQEQQQQQTVEVINIIDNSEDVKDDIELDLEFDESEDVSLEETAPEEEEDQIFIYVKNMPEYPGGIVALKRYIAENIIYPAVANENGIEGTVFLRFEVTKTGSIGKVELQKGVDKLLDDEAKRVIKSLPKFTPGEQNGKKVNVWFSIPVTFKLN